MIDRGARRRRARQVARQAVVEVHVDQQRELPVHQIGQIGDRDFQRVHRERDMAAVEVAAVQHALVVGIDQRVVVRAVQLVLDVAAHPGQAHRAHADHVRRAADRIAVLQTMPRRVVAPGQIGANPGGGFGLARVRLHFEQQSRRNARRGRRAPRSTAPSAARQAASDDRRARTRDRRGPSSPRCRSSARALLLARASSGA